MSEQQNPLDGLREKIADPEAMVGDKHAITGPATMQDLGLMFPLSDCHGRLWVEIVREDGEKELVMVLKPDL